jgi:ABC-type multidrug transport system ATPase subunit
MGHCSQDNVLWMDLTAWQHLQLYASLRGALDTTSDEQLLAALRKFDLHKVAHQVVGGFSGGMMRRLSSM